MTLRQQFVALCFGLLAGASVGKGEEVWRPIVLADLAGRLQTPFHQPGQKATVLFFVLPDCPISNASSPEIQRIASEYAGKGVSSFVIYVDPALSADAARKHAEEYGFSGSVLLDHELKLAKQAGATIAPEVVVLTSDGKIQYRGRVNNLYSDYGKRRAQPSQHDLRDALEAILAGRPVPNPVTVSIGCQIPLR